MDKVFDFINKATGEALTKATIKDRFWGLIVLSIGFFLSAVILGWWDKKTDFSESDRFRSLFDLYMKNENISYYVVLVILGLLLSLGIYFLCITVYPKIKCLIQALRRFNCQEVTMEKMQRCFDWQGNLYKGNCKRIELASSSEGMISKKTWFGKVTLKFKTKFIQQGFGIIVAAMNLENCFMLRIVIGKDSKNENYIEIVPHVRQNGIWDILKALPVNEKGKPVEDYRTLKAIEYVHQFRKIDLSQDYLVDVTYSPRTRKVQLKIERNGDKICDLNYILPSFFTLVSLDLQKKVGVDEKKAEPGASLVRKINWPCCFSRFGFRAFGYTERTVIWDLEVNQKS